MFKVGEEVFGLKTGFAGIVREIDPYGMVRVWWYTFIETTVPASQLMNSSDHLRMVRDKEIEAYKPALMEVANRWSNRPQSER